MLELMPSTSAANVVFVAERAVAGERIEIAADVGETLRSDSVEGLRSLPRRGLEIGGILLGSAEGSCRVTGLAPVISEHLYGPRYQQSSKDRALFESRLAELRDESNVDAKPIGMYRTQIKSEAGPDERDSDAFRKYFPESAGIFILVTPQLTGQATLSCFYWDREKMIPCDSFERRELQIDPPPVPRAPGRGKRWTQEAVLAGIAGLVVWGIVILVQHQPSAAVVMPAAAPAALAPRTKARPLQLQAVTSSQGAEVHWDSRADVLRAATGGLLTVESGDDRTELPISRAELNTGKFFYGEVGPLTTFVLTVYRSNGSPDSQSFTLRAPEMQLAATVPAPVPAVAAAPPPRQPRNVQEEVDEPEPEPLPAPEPRRREREAIAPKPPQPAPVPERRFTLPPPVTVSSGSIMAKP